MLQAQPSEMKKWRYAGRLFGTINLEEVAMSHVDPLLGNGDETTSIARAAGSQQTV
jgi:hypothetical protein